MSNALRAVSTYLLRLSVLIVLGWIMTTGVGDMQALAAHIVRIPISAAIRIENGSGFNTIVMTWDQRGTPDPMKLEWGNSQVSVRGSALSPLTGAFDYALTKLGPTLRPKGTLSLSTVSSAPLGTEGPSAGAALAIGFLAVFSGDRLIDGIVLTGTLEPTGRIGQVKHIRDKLKAAAREGYRLLLVPRGQLPAPRINLVGIGVQANMIVREVGTIEEAYEIMTGRTLPR